MGEFAARGKGFPLTRTGLDEKGLTTMDRRTFLKATTLSVLAVNGAKVLARQSKSSANKSNAVRLDSDGMLVANGRQREFIIGLYTLPNAPEPWQEARDAGFNLVYLLHRQTRPSIELPVHPSRPDPSAPSHALERGFAPV